MLNRQVLQNRWIAQQPTEQQAIFLGIPSREALYGGAAGGGKSSALLMAALMYVDEPGYSALILRKSYADLSLPGAIMDRSHDWLHGKAKWSEIDKTWTFPRGATLTFGYLQHANDMYRYQGAEFQFIGFDELTQFNEIQYRYLFSRLRRLESSDVPLRVRGASNPGGIGHEWVYQRFMVEGRQALRIFVPAKLADNPYLDQAAYLESLMVLDPVTRAQLLHGDWRVRPPGRKFQRQWFEVVAEAPAGKRTVRYWDLAATEPKPGTDPDWTAGCKMTEDQGVFYLQDMRRGRLTPHHVEQLIRQTAELDGHSTHIYIEQEPGASGKNTIDHYQREVLKGFTVYGNRATGSKEERANPVSAAAEAGNVKLVRGTWIGPFLDEAEAFPPNDGGHDDQIDATSGAHSQLAIIGSRSGYSY